jgi:hypothetical protein
VISNAGATTSPVSSDSIPPRPTFCAFIGAGEIVLAKRKSARNPAIARLVRIVERIIPVPFFGKPKQHEAAHPRLRGLARKTSYLAACTDWSYHTTIKNTSQLPHEGSFIGSCDSQYQQPSALTKRSSPRPLFPVKMTLYSSICFGCAIRAVTARPAACPGMIVSHHDGDAASHCRANTPVHPYVHYATMVVDRHHHHHNCHHGCPRATMACTTGKTIATGIKLGSKGEALAVGLLGVTGNPQRKNQQPPRLKGLGSHSHAKKADKRAWEAIPMRRKQTKGLGNTSQITAGRQASLPRTGGPACPPPDTPPAG